MTPQHSYYQVAVIGYSQGQGGAWRRNHWRSCLPHGCCRLSCLCIQTEQLCHKASLQLDHDEVCFIFQVVVMVVLLVSCTMACLLSVLSTLRLLAVPHDIYYVHYGLAFLMWRLRPAGIWSRRRPGLPQPPHPPHRHLPWSSSLCPAKTRFVPRDKLRRDRMVTASKLEIPIMAAGDRLCDKFKAFTCATIELGSQNIYRVINICIIFLSHGGTGLRLKAVSKKEEVDWGGEKPL